MNACILHKYTETSARAKITRHREGGDYLGADPYSQDDPQEPTVQWVADDRPLRSNGAHSNPQATDA